MTYLQVLLEYKRAIKTWKFSIKITIFRFVYYFLKMYGQIYTAEILCFHLSHFIFPNYVKNRGRQFSKFALKSRNSVGKG
jgi:hypothetical protein